MVNTPWNSRNGQFQSLNISKSQFNGGKTFRYISIVCISIFFMIAIYTGRTNKYFVQDVLLRGASVGRSYVSGTRNTTRHKFDTRTLANLTDDVTVVTAYFNIGNFNKGGSHLVFTPSQYHLWFSAFSYTENPVIAFMDNESDAMRFRLIRSRFPDNHTQVIILRRNQTHSFGLIPNISEIYSQPGYPKFTPNTVVPGYSAAMNAKYEIMQRAIDVNPFRTKYFCWQDIGFFRDLISNSSAPWAVRKTFQLYLPNGLRENAVAYANIYGRNSALNATDIIYGNHVWVGGGFFIGRWDVMRKWTEEYLAAVDNLVKRKLMSTDQQVIYIMMNENSTQTDLQIFQNNGRLPQWFFLGYLARDEAQRRKKLTVSSSHRPHLFSTSGFVPKRLKATSILFTLPNTSVKTKSGP